MEIEPAGAMRGGRWVDGPIAPVGIRPYAAGHPKTCPATKARLCPLVPRPFARIGGAAYGASLTRGTVWPAQPGSAVPLRRVESAII